MRARWCLATVVLVLNASACGGNGGDGGDGLSLTPDAGPASTPVTVSPTCADPPLTAEWVSPSGFSSYVASTESQSKLGLTSVPSDATPGTYTVVVTCGNDPAPVGEATCEVEDG